MKKSTKHAVLLLIVLTKMKIKLHFKTPGALDYAMERLTSEEADVVEQLASRWIEYQEYVTVEIDTEEKTCVVVER